MRLHLIEGEPGCDFARENGHVAVVVDALRASATAAMLLDAGASEIVVVREVEGALALKRDYPDALLFGERGGLPPAGFDFGNSPQTVSAAKGRRVIFTTTTGAQRLVSSWGAAAVFIGTTVNATAVASWAMNTARKRDADIVLIPAGLAIDPDFNAQEDWVAATAIALRCEADIGAGAKAFSLWKERIHEEGINVLFHSAPHAATLRAIGLDSDIDFCARVDVTDAVPEAGERTAQGVVCGRADAQAL